MNPVDQHRKLMVPNIEQPGGQRQFSGGQQSVTIATLKAATNNLVNVAAAGSLYVALENHSSHAVGVAFRNSQNAVNFYAVLLPMEAREWVFPAPVQSFDLQDLAYNNVTPAGTLAPEWSLTLRDDIALIQSINTILSGGTVICTYADAPITSRRTDMRPKPTNMQQSAIWSSNANHNQLLNASGATGITGGLAYGPFSSYLCINAGTTPFSVQPESNSLGALDTFTVPVGGAITLPVECDKININFTAMTAGFQQVTGFQTVTGLNTQAY